MRSILSRIELHGASICFVLLFFTLLFRVGSGVLVSMLIFIQNTIGTSSDGIEYIVRWISKNVQWTGEGAQWLWVWLVALGMAEAEREESNLKVDFLMERFNPIIQRWVKLAVDLLYASMVIFLFVLSFEELERSKHALPVTLPFSNIVLYASFTVGLFFLGLRIVLRIIRTFSNRHKLEGV